MKYQNEIDSSCDTYLTCEHVRRDRSSVRKRGSVESIVSRVTTLQRQSIYSIKKNRHSNDKHTATTNKTKKHGTVTHTRVGFFRRNSTRARAHDTKPARGVGHVRRSRTTGAAGKQWRRCRRVRDEK